MQPDLQAHCCNPRIQGGHKIPVHHFGMRCPSCGYLIRGTKIAGKYEVIQWIGEGGFGEVYEIQEVTRLRRKLVLKISRSENLGQSGGISTEAELLSFLGHANVLVVTPLRGDRNTSRQCFLE